MGDTDPSSDGDDVPLLGEDLEVLREHGTSPGSPTRGGNPEATRIESDTSHGAGGLEMAEFTRPGRREEALWEAFQDLFLTLQETGARAKGATHALAPHCLRPFMRLTPEVVQGALRPGAQFSREPPDKSNNRVFSHAHRATPRLRPASSGIATYPRTYPRLMTYPRTHTIQPTQSSMRCTSDSCFPLSRRCSSLSTGIPTR